MAPTADICSAPKVCSPTKGGMPRSASAAALNKLQQQLLLVQQPGANIEAAAEELSHLTRKVHNRKRIMATPGALPAIVSMLGSATAAARFAAAALQNLAIEPEHCPELIEAGCMQPLLQLLQQTSDDHDTLLAAIAGALANLACEEVGTNSTIAAAPGCVSRLVELLSHSSCVVREAAASVLAKVAWEPELCKPIAGGLLFRSSRTSLRRVWSVPACPAHKECRHVARTQSQQHTHAATCAHHSAAVRPRHHRRLLPRRRRRRQAARVPPLHRAL